MNSKQKAGVGICAFLLLALLLVHYPFDGYMTHNVTGDLPVGEWTSWGALAYGLADLKTVAVLAILVIAAGGLWTWFWRGGTEA